LVVGRVSFFFFFFCGFRCLCLCFVLALQYGGMRISVRVSAGRAKKLENLPANAGFFFIYCIHAGHAGLGDIYTVLD
jgi:hypothetical protein